MFHRKNFCLLSVLLGLLVFAGCTSDETSLLEPNQPAVANDLYTDNLYTDFDNIMQDHGLQVPTPQSGEKYIPVPSPLLFASQAAGARGAAINGTSWDPYTAFVIAKQGYIGYEISWLEDIPEDPDPNAYYWYYFSDVPEKNPKKPLEVDPFVEPIDVTIDRVSDILINHPELATERVHVSDDTWLYVYTFKYPVRNSIHIFRMFKVRLYITD